MKTRIGFTKMVSNEDAVTHYYSPDNTILIRTAKNGEKTVSQHSDNCNNIYQTEQGKRIGLSFTVNYPISTTHDSKGKALPKDKKGKLIGSIHYEIGQVYHTSLMRIPFARTFGYNGIGHSKTFLRNKGIRSAQGKVIGE
ncbi:hypothetical protein [Methanomethylovorans sp.]|uniref:hypothetical protein n=1 Tax=Methanomethylovorans sp. TaxID=2758717 RepID=UPI00351C50C2